MSARPALAAFPFKHEAVLALLLAGLLLAAGAIQPAFTRIDTQIELSTHIWELALLTLPMTLVIITGGIDLSVGATMALSAVALGLTCECGWGMPAAVLAAVTTGAAAGLLNGVFVAYVRVHPLIVTLATLSAYRGIAEGISLGRPITGFPDDFALLGRGSIAHFGSFVGIPIPAVVFMMAALAAGIVLARTTLGRSIYAIGLNEAASRFSGIRTQRIKLWLYALSGLTAGWAAVMFVARRNTAKADIGTGLELDVITAVVLGGSSIFGGRGRIIGTILGVLLIHETREFVSWKWNNDELIAIVIGVLLIVSVLMNRGWAARTR